MGFVSHGVRFWVQIGKEDNCWCVRCGVDGLARTFAFWARVEHVVLLRPVGMEE